MLHDLADKLVTELAADIGSPTARPTP